ncbi:peptidase M32 [Endozoicomonas sp. (ex Bugula neritina AB1)]|nr:peptidase M32 [Endozoicomonas sp. (ex Bugula neritina AB1)]
MGTAYQNLVDRFQQIYRLQHLGSMANWDQSTMMPAGGNQARSEAMAELNALLHDLLTKDEIGDWIQEAKQQNSDSETLASIREMECEYTNATVMPDQLVRAKTLASSRCEHAWRAQRPDNDWAGFSKNLTDVVKLTQEEASIRAEQTGTTRYNALLNLYEPGMTTTQLDQVFSDMKSWLPTFIQEAVQLQKNKTIIKPEGPFFEQHQKALSHEVMTLLGFDFNHGRLDVSTHPFCGGVSEDVRLTTRYKNNDFVEALMGTIHETGHARYEQNRPDNRYLPIGRYRSMGIHESQSLFFEMQLGRSSEFLAQLQPLIIKHLCHGEPKAFSNLPNLERIYTEVKPGKIRVEADEITYPAHVILRYEIERALIEGDIDVNDIPELWHQKMQESLNITIGNDYTNGCMQDIHWPMAAFGYFPSYTLGAMYAAQLFAALKQQHPDIKYLISQGNLSPIFEWLNTHIWSQASRYPTDELITRATGESLNEKYLKNHLQRRYLKN